MGVPVDFEALLNKINGQITADSVGIKDEDELGNVRTQAALLAAVMLLAEQPGAIKMPKRTIMLVKRRITEFFGDDLGKPAAERMSNLASIVEKAIADLPKSQAMEQ